MANRSVSVKLTAEIADFQAKMRLAQQQTKDFADQTVRQAGQHRQSWEMVGKSALIAGTAVAAGLGLAVVRMADFDKAMSNVSAATMETGAGLDSLREAALRAGSDTAFSATEAAQGIEALAKAGVSTADILNGGLNGALDLAAAGGLDVGQAAEIAASALTQFKLRGQDVTKVADLLAAGAGKAQGDVTDLGAALNQSGLVASQVGLSIEETTGALAAFAKAGLIGSDSGTAFKSMLQRLTPQSAEAQREMDRLGISAYDAQGQFVGLEEFAGNLQAAMRDLTPEARNAAMSVIFGSDAVRAATVLFNEGETGVRDWISAVDDSGFAAEQARLRTDNLRGDIERLGGAIDTALIGSGSSANDVLRSLTQRVEFLVDSFNNAPKGVQQTATAVTGVAGAASLAGGAAILAVPKLVEFHTALGQMGPAGLKAQRGLSAVGGALAGPWGLGLAAATIGVGLFAESQFRAAQRVEQLSATLDQQTGALTDATRAVTVKNLQDRGAFENAKELGISLDLVTDAAMGQADAMREVQEATEAAMATAQGAGGNPFTGESASAAAEAAKNLRQEIGAYSDEQDRAQALTRDTAAALGEQAAAAEGAGGAMETMASQVDTARQEIDGLVQSLASAGLVQLSTRDAARQWEQSLDDLTASIEENGTTLDRNTQAGRDNEAALDAVAQAAIGQAQAIYDSTQNEEQFRTSLLQSREGLVAAARQMGLSEEAAQQYADQVLAIPAVKSTSFVTPGLDAAIQNTSILRESLRQIGDKTVRVTTQFITSGNPNDLRVNKFGGDGMADGGLIPRGLGGPRQDNVPIWASSGEFVVNAAATARHLPVLEAINAGAFADGGRVGGGGAAGSGTVTAVLAAEDRALLRAVASRPIALDGRVVAESTNAHNNSRREY